MMNIMEIDEPIIENHPTGPLSRDERSLIDALIRRGLDLESAVSTVIAARVERQCLNEWSY